MENKKNNALISTSSTSLVKLYSKNSESHSKHEYVHGTKRIEYFVFRTRRRKTSEIVVDSDEIIVRVPYSKQNNNKIKMQLWSYCYLLR